MNEKYNFSEIEKKWQKYWEDNKVFKTVEDETKKKFYCLEMFPYPSGKLHMGHVRNYSIGDVVARFKKMDGIMCFILWAGTLLVFLRRMLPSNMEFIRVSGHGTISQK